MKTRWMAYAMAAALGLGTVGEALAQAPGGAPPAPTNSPAVQKQDVQQGKGAAKGKKTRRRRGNKTRSKQGTATGHRTQGAQPAAAQPR
jgi:hypothetical protein